MTKTRRIEYHIWIIRNGAEFGEARCVSAPQIRMSSDAEIKKTLNAKVILPDGVDMLHDMLAPRMLIDGVEYPLGEYYIGTCTEVTNDYGQRVADIEAYDGGFLPSRYRTENIYHIAAGDKYTDVIQALLIESGITKLLVSDNPATFATAREDWEIGTDYLTIINDLLAEINYGSLWFDNNGYARIEPKRAVSADDVHHVYTSGKYSVLAVSNERETDIFDKYNVFIAYVDNADNDELMIAKAVNDDPASILSVQNRGRIQAPPKRLNNIASQDELQAYVDNWRNQSMTSVETLKISTEIDRDHAVLDTVQCEDNLYLETGWSLTLGEEYLLDHTLQREYYI